MMKPPLIVFLNDRSLGKLTDLLQLLSLACDLAMLSFALTAIAAG